MPFRQKVQVARRRTARWGKRRVRRRLRSQDPQVAKSCMVIPSSDNFSRGLICRTLCVFAHDRMRATIRMKTKEKVGE